MLPGPRRGVNRKFHKKDNNLMTRSLSAIICTAFSALNLFAAQPADQILKDIKTEYAPDRRTELYDIKVHEYPSVTVLTGRTTSAEALARTVERLSADGRKIVSDVRLLPDQRMKGEIYGVVDIAVATVRCDADYSSEAQTQLLMGMPVRLLDNDGWYYVQTPEGYLGWVAQRGIAPMTREEYNAWIEAPKAVYLPTAGLIYSQPDAKSQPVSDITAGAILRTGKKQGKFVEVLFPKGRTGYVLRSEVQDFGDWKLRRPTPDAVIETAKRFLGTSYLWSGTSPKMLDCSGFAKTVYLLNGLVLARDASQQCLTGEPVDVAGNDWSRLQKGDLVFFGTGRVTHVGIYIGDGRFIHEAGLVHISSFNPEHEEYSAHWLGRLIRATRIIGTEDSGKGVWSVEKCPLYNEQ